MQLIVHNLIANAIQFSDRGKPVRVALAGNKEQLLITVEDGGVGLDINEIEKIFQRFVQLNSGTTKTCKGHGLGLSIAKAYLDLISGEINVTSKINKGSSFVVSLKALTEKAGCGEDSQGFLF